MEGGAKATLGIKFRCFGQADVHIFFLYLSVYKSRFLFVSLDVVPSLNLFCSPSPTIKTTIIIKCPVSIYLGRQFSLASNPKSSLQITCDKASILDP